MRIDICAPYAVARPARVTTLYRCRWYLEVAPVQSSDAWATIRAMRDPILLAAVALAGALLALWLARTVRRWRGSRRAKIRAGRAGAGEDRAAVLLVRAGFSIVARQAMTSWAPFVDGEPLEIVLRADYLVARSGELLVAEVKTGDEAPSLSTAATRRQLLEYS